MDPNEPNSDHPSSLATRVLFVLGSLGIGGTERQVLEILRRLDRNRFAPHLYLVYRRGELLAEIPPDVPTVAYWDQIQPPRWNFPGRILWSQARHLARAIRDWRIQLVYDRASHAAITALLGTPSHIPRVSAVVADPRRDFEQSHRSFPWLKRALLRRAYHRAARVLAVSSGVRESLVSEYGLLPDQVAVCPNLFDFDRLRELAAAPPPAPPPRRLVVSCVGRLQREKGQATLLEALDLLVHRRGQLEFLLWMVGDGPDAAALREYVRTRQLEDHVVFCGYQANPLPFVRASQVFCLPSWFEGMPNALIEAMACGTPVIAADCPSGPAEILEQGRWGRLVPSGDAVALADALADRRAAWLNSSSADLSETAEETWRLRADAAREHVQRTFTADRGIEQLESILAQVASNPTQETGPLHGKPGTAER